MELLRLIKEAYEGSKYIAKELSDGFDVLGN